MKHEPIGLYIFRFISGFALLGFMAMLYWSSTILEQDLKYVQGELKQIKSDLFTLKEQIVNVRTDLLKEIVDHPLTPGSPSAPVQKALASNANNLLKPDPFYLQTLPKLLGPHFKPSGTRKEAVYGKPDNLHPFSGWSHIANWNGMCTGGLVGQELGKYETFVPEMAEAMELRYTKEGQPEYWLFLRKNVFWHPLNPNHFPSDVQLAPEFLRPHEVTAHDYKFYYDAVMNRHVEESSAVAIRLYFSDIEEVRVEDDHTLVVRWKPKLIKMPNGQETYRMKYMAKNFTGSLRPLASFVYKHFADGAKIIPEDNASDTYRTNPVWAQNFSHHWAQNIIVSCGPWLFDGMTDREIRFRRNPNHYDPYAVLVDAYEIKFRDSPDGIWEDFKNGSLDLFEVPPNLLSEAAQFLKSSPYEEQAKQNLKIKRLDYLARTYNYIGWNEARPHFKSAKVRQALTLAIDRERIIRQNLNGMGMQTTGTFFPFSPSYDSSLKPYPFDPDRARHLLQEEGWSDHNGDGILDKFIDGKRISFSFNLTYFVKNPTTKAICDYIATALKEIGVECNLNGVDMADLSALFENKDFDALLLGWALGTPPEDPKQLWYSSGAKERGSSNAIGFANPEIDRIIDQLEYEFDPQKRIELYHRFDAIIYEEAPYTFLYVPKITLLYRDYLQNVFIPAERQELIPGANVGEPQSSIFWLSNRQN